MGKANLFKKDNRYLVCQGNQNMETQFQIIQKSNQIRINHNLLLAIRKTTKNHFSKERMKKSDLSRLIWGFYKNPSKSTFFFVYEPKIEDLVMEAQNFPNLFFVFYKTKSTPLFINSNQYKKKKKNRAYMTCTKTIRKPNSSNFLNHRKIQTS